MKRLSPFVLLRRGFSSTAPSAVATLGEDECFALVYLYEWAIIRFFFLLIDICPKSGVGDDTGHYSGYI